ncbi:MAG: di-heme-cytochrome C peroxidase [Gammaproteobacteria bacterium]
MFAVTALSACLWSWLPTPAAASDVIYAAQGRHWSASERLTFYSQDQGSRLMPLKWIFALKQADGNPFMADNLARYGYLPNEKAVPEGLPVGFTVNRDSIGMTCAACHTRQIEAAGTAYRIDGGPAIADFQSFAADLDRAVERIISDSQAFAAFAVSVLGGAPSEEQKNRLRREVTDWFLPYHTLMSIALPKANPWGPARVDAVGMIFNRLAGLDIGTHPDHIIQSNFRTADTPVRYPFLWNAPIQDKTQWPGFADNGNDLLALSRNLGEVLGVFADFHPKKSSWQILGIDYLSTNSANFEGLKTLERLVKKIGPPEWPWKQGKWAINSELAAQGKYIFDSTTKTEAGGCASCHGIRDGMPRSLQKTWATPLCNVETDEKQFDLLQWTVDTGVLAGARIPFLDAPLKASGESAVRVLGVAVMGSILQRAKSPAIHDFELKAKTDIALIEKLIGEEKINNLKKIKDGLLKKQTEMMTAENSVLKGAFRISPSHIDQPKTGKYRCKNKFTDPAPQVAYESRVLEGIWAAAPYLHNGSVPTLAALLEPVENRPSEFKIGPSYDPENVGLAAEQTKFDFVLKTTACANKKSGNSRCGHEFGTRLSKKEKKALLEYLKIL